MAISITLSKDEQLALERLAWAERRRVNQQAALLVRRSLQQAGLLPADPAPAQAEAQPQEAARVEAAQPA
jgi:hypothetical protein